MPIEIVFFSEKVDIMFIFWNIVVLTMFAYPAHSFFNKRNEDAVLKVPQLIEKYGYNGETHSVTTEDGYTLNFHRISGGPKSPPRNGKKVCFLMHGLTAQSSQWVITGPDQALAYQLADEGYDVWMGNSRGTDYGLKHTEYEPFGSQNDQKSFWAFSWHEIGVYDIPAMIDYVLAHTGQKKIQYVGHSQGATSYFIMVSEKPEYNEKIEAMHAFAPAVFVHNAKFQIAQTISPYTQTLKKMIDFTSAYYVSSKTQKKLCRDMPGSKYFCAYSLSQIMGRPTDQMNISMVPVIYGHFAEQVATYQSVHFSQLIESGEFRQLDHGQNKNIERYGHAEPPKYNLENSKAPVAIYYGESDWITVPNDIKRLISELPNVVLDYLVPHKAFNHADFAYGKDARRLVYDEVLKTIKLTEE